MKDLVKRLERSHEFWIILSLSFLFFLLRLPSLFEPYWYGDEGIYETIGLALTRGRTLYTQIWDNKPPLLYYTYALVHSNQFLIRSLALVVGIATIIIFYFLAKKLFQDKNSAVIATGILAILFGLPMFEGNIANAENFMLLPIITAALLTYQSNSKKLTGMLLIFAGLLLGVAFLYKIVAIFDFAAFFVFIVISTFTREFSIKTMLAYFTNFWKPLAIFVLCFIVPFVITLIYFILKGGLGAYINATFLSTVGYVGYNNVFIIPQGLLISKLLLLLAVILILFIKRRQIPSSVLFILLWLGFSLFNSFFSQRPYTHYLIILIPTFSLLIGQVYRSRKTHLLTGGITVIVLGVILLNYFNHWSMSKTLNYYSNFSGFITGKKSLSAYDAFFDRRTLRDNELVLYINSHKKINTSIFVWGNSAQIYPLTNTLPPGRFTVAYHIAGNKPYEQETALALRKNPPEYLVIMNDVSAYPFQMYNYKQVLRIQNTDIYERIY